MCGGGGRGMGGGGRWGGVDPEACSLVKLSNLDSPKCHFVHFQTKLTQN